MNDHFPDCSCIDCIRGLGQLAPALPIAPGLPALPTMPQAPATPTALPSPPLTPAPGLLPPASGPASVLPPSPTADYQAGLTAFQQVTAKHTILRTNIMTPTSFPDALTLQTWYSQNASTFEQMVTTVLPLGVQQIVDLVNWLGQVLPGQSWSPSQMLGLVNQEILGGAVTIPQVEIPARVVNFLSSVLRSIVTGSEEARINSQIDTAYTGLFAAITILQQTQAALIEAENNAAISSGSIEQHDLAVAQTNLQLAKNQLAKDQSASLTASFTASDQASAIAADQKSVSTAASAVSSAREEDPTLTFADAVTIAEGNVATATGTVNAIQAQISSFMDQLAALASVTLTPDQLAQYLLDNLPESDALSTFSSAYYELESNLEAGAALMAPLLAQEQSELQAELPYQNALTAAMTAFTTAREPIQQAIEMGAVADADDLAAYATAQTNLTVAQDTLVPFQDAVTAIQNQITAAIQANPNYFPDGQPQPEATTVASLISGLLTTLATQNPSLLMTVIENAMATEASDADTRIAALEAQQTTLINEKQTLFQTYFQAQAEADLEVYQNQIAQAQDGFNSFNDQLQTLSNQVQADQNAMNASINALSNIIGWWANTQGLSASVMSEPYFIQAALTMISNAGGSLDTVNMTDPSTGTVHYNTPLWTGPGLSEQVAGLALTQLQTMNDDYANYQMNSPALIATLNHLNSWITQLQQAYQVTYQMMDTATYTQTVMTAFQATPQGHILASDTQMVVNPMRAITTQVSADQQTMENILDDLEAQVLSNNGMNLNDLGTYAFQQQMQIWVGVCDHLETNGPNYDTLLGYINQIEARLQANTPETNDAENLQIAQLALMNLIGAQLIYRKLSQNSNFMSELQAACTADTAAAAQAASTATGSTTPQPITPVNPSQPASTLTVSSTPGSVNAAAAAAQVTNFPSTSPSTPASGGAA
jgi:hypothetical protein